MSAPVISKIFRFINAGMVAILGIALVSSSYEVMGAISFLISFSMLVRGAGIVILTFVINFMIFGVVTLIYWSPWGAFGEISFGEWLEDYWWVPASYMVFAAFSTIRSIGDQETAWKLLSKTYPPDSSSAEDLERYPSASGVMKIDDDAYSVIARHLPNGILLTWEEKQPLFLPWERIDHVRPGPPGSHVVDLYVKRKLGPARIFRIPWKGAVTIEGLE